MGGRLICYLSANCSGEMAEARSCARSMKFRYAAAQSTAAFDTKGTVTSKSIATGWRVRIHVVAAWICRRVRRARRGLRRHGWRYRSCRSVSPGSHSATTGTCAAFLPLLRIVQTPRSYSD
jgi:hypothetical protein